MCVEWVDIEVHSNGEDAWMYAEKVEEHCTEETEPFYSVGFLVFENNDYIFMTETIGSDRSGSLVKIPKGVIKNRWRLQPDDPLDGGQ